MIFNHENGQHLLSPICKILSLQSMENRGVIGRNYHSLRRMHVRGDGNSHQMVRQPVTVAQEGDIPCER